MKLYLDEDVKPLLAEMLRAQGMDCLSTREAGNLSKSDSEQLSFAASQHRTILTFNIPDFLRLASTWAQAGRDHGGIIVSDQLPPPKLLRRLLALHAQIARVGEGRHHRYHERPHTYHRPSLRRLLIPYPPVSPSSNNLLPALHPCDASPTAPHLMLMPALSCPR